MMIENRLDNNGSNGLATAVRMIRDHEDNVRVQVAKAYASKLAILAKEVATLKAMLLQDGPGTHVHVAEAASEDKPDHAVSGLPFWVAPAAKPELFDLGRKFFSVPEAVAILGRSETYVLSKVTTKRPENVQRHLIHWVDLARQINYPIWPVKATAEMLGLGEETLRKAIRTGRLPVTQVASTPGFGPPTMAKLAPADVVAFLGL
jgi:hypothetical protein